MNKGTLQGTGFGRASDFPTASKFYEIKSSTTWVKPKWATMVFFEIINGGAGGGAGYSNNNTATACYGGGAGASGETMRFRLFAGDLPDRIRIAVGAGGAGGTAGATNGNAGSAGTTSNVYLNPNLTLYVLGTTTGANPGSGGTTTTGTSGVGVAPSITHEIFSNTNGFSATGTSTAPTAATGSLTVKNVKPANAGGSIPSGAATVGAGGDITFGSATDSNLQRGVVTIPGGAGSLTLAGSPGTNAYYVAGGPSIAVALGASGGSGGGASAGTGTAGGAGGPGMWPGGAGGGGGASYKSSGGAGGKGADGVVRIWCW